jgi:hypothetical protein
LSQFSRHILFSFLLELTEDILNIDQNLKVVKLKRRSRSAGRPKPAGRLSEVKNGAAFPTQNLKVDKAPPHSLLKRERAGGRQRPARRLNLPNF